MECFTCELEDNPVDLFFANSANSVCSFIERFIELHTLLYAKH